MAIGANFIVLFLVVEGHRCVRVGDSTCTANIPSGINSPFGTSSSDGFGHELTVFGGMAPPFSGVLTPHRVEVRGQSYRANCAWDALASPTQTGHR
jgi:hypothetical protein